MCLYVPSDFSYDPRSETELRLEAKYVDKQSASHNSKIRGSDLAFGLPVLCLSAHGFSLGTPTYSHMQKLCVLFSLKIQNSAQVLSVVICLYVPNDCRTSPG